MIASNHAPQGASDSRCMLVVEDCHLLAETTKDFLETAGFEVECADSVTSALHKIAQFDFDIALLDIYLGTELVYPVANHLDDLGIPYVFVSGAHYGTLPHKLTGRPYLAKPYRTHVLLDLLKSLNNETVHHGVVMDVSSTPKEL